MIEAKWESDQTFDLIRLREFIPLGQRIESFEVDAMVDGTWKKIANATSVGACRIIALDSPVTTNAIRLRITSSPVAVTLAELGIFKKLNL